MDSGDSSQNHSTDWQLRYEIKVTLITELIKTSSYDTVVTNLYEAACFANVDDITNCKISILKSDAGSVLKNLVSLVGSSLEESVLLLETDRGTLWSNFVPSLFIQYRFSGAQLHLSVFVQINDSGGKNASVSEILDDVT